MGFVIQAADPESAAGTVVAGLAEAFGITSYNQKRILLDVTTDLFRTQRGFTFPWLVAELELLREALKHSFDLKANIVRLLTRFEPYGDLYRLFIVMAKVDAIPGGLIEIVQLSDLPAHQRKHLTAFLLSLLWSQIRSSNEDCRLCDTLIIDELQNLEINADSSLYSMIRESRKFGLQLVLSTQFLTGFSAEARDALQMCGTRLYFHPTSQDINAISALLSEERQPEWRKLLRGLERGEAVLSGQYRLKEGTRTSSLPIKVIIGSEGCREEDESVIYRVVDGDRFAEEPSEGQNEQLPALIEKTVNGIFRPIRFIGPNSFGRGGGPGE